MLSFFPTPYPDELLYSVLARYHVRSGNISSKATMTELFRTSTITAVIDMPSGINALVGRLPSEKRIKAYDLIMENTLFPYYTAFLPEVRISAVIAAMMGNKGGSIHTMTGIMASSISTPEYLRFCPICAKEDKAKYGEYYWHRLHQIPGVLLCPVHNTAILDSTVNLAMQNKHEFIAANEQNCINKTAITKYGDIDLERLLKLSKDIDWIIKYYDITRKSVTSNKGLRDSYISLLKEKGYATVNGRVYQENLISDFVKFYGCDYLEIVQSKVENETNWVSGIVRKHRKSFHPIRHLLLMRFLYNSVEEFFLKSNKYQPFGKGPWPCLNAASEHYRKLVIKKINITHCCDTKFPVGTFECSCGFAYSRRGYDATKDDLYKIGRIKNFGHIWEEKLRSLIEDKNLGLRETARQLAADPKTIKIYAEKLGLKTKWNEINDRIHETIKINISESTIDKNNTMLGYHRSAWISVIQVNPCASKTELRKLAKANYAWLYRHDREWLNENSPKPKSILMNKGRVDWKERDALVLKKIKSVVKDILLAKGKPIRLSLSRIGKNSEQLGLLEKHLDKMPLTKAYIESVVEDDSDYRKRRVRWAVCELNNSGKEPKVWNVMRKAGIRSEYLSWIENYIQCKIEEIKSEHSKCQV
ncbi:MAG: TnsD family transposase [Clostridia bacterium]|nr:TnsD family transposase [Clostridia bacterium]